MQNPRVGQEITAALPDSAIGSAGFVHSVPSQTATSLPPTAAQNVASEQEIPVIGLDQLRVETFHPPSTSIQPSPAESSTAQKPSTGQLARMLSCQPGDCADQEVPSNVQPPPLVPAATQNVLLAQDRVCGLGLYSSGTSVTWASAAQLAPFQR